MFLSFKNFINCLFILLQFHLVPKYFLKLIMGKKIFKKKNFFLFEEKNKNFEVIDPQINFNEINLICRGKSFNKYKNEINFELPTFFVNYYFKDKTDIDEIIYEKDNFFGITADFKAKKKMKKNFKKTILILNGYEKNKKKTFSYWEGQNEIDQELMIDKDISDNAKNIFQKLNHSKLLINFHNDEEQLDLGSALCVLVFLAKISKKINVYGYDHYLKSEIAEMNYIKLMYSIFSETSKINPKPVKQSFIKSIINYYFIEYYENLENININSYLKNLRRHKYLIKLINKVFINPY